MRISLICATASLSLGGIPATFDTTIGTITGCDITVMPAPDMQTVLNLAAAWDTSAGDPAYNAACDLNGDNWVDVSDLIVLVMSWGS